MKRIIGQPQTPDVIDRVYADTLSQHYARISPDANFRPFSINTQPA